MAGKARPAESTRAWMRRWPQRSYPSLQASARFSWLLTRFGRRPARSGCSPRDLPSCVLPAARMVSARSGPRGLAENAQILFLPFFGVLRDWITISGDQNSIQAEPDVSRALDERMKELATAGFTVAARERFLLLTGGSDAKPERWRIVDIKVQPAVLVRITGAIGRGL